MLLGHLAQMLGDLDFQPRDEAASRRAVKDGLRARLGGEHVAQYEAGDVDAHVLRVVPGEARIGLGLSADRQTENLRTGG